MKGFILGFISGGVIAGTATYFITKKVIENKCQEDINEMKAHVKEKSQGEKSKNEDENKEAPSEEDSEDDDDKEDPREKEALKYHKNKIPDKPLPKEYKNIARTYAADDGIDRDELDETPDDTGDEDPENRPDIEIISIDEYGGTPEYEGNCLEYYVKDGQLCYEGGELVDDEKYLIGNALDDSGWRNNDDDDSSLYVRNHRISEDFEICKVFGYYGDLN